MNPNLSETVTVDRAIMYECVSAEVNSLLEGNRFRANYDEVYVRGGFQTLFASMLLEAQEAHNKQFADSSQKQTLANPAEQIKDLSRFAMEYFQEQIRAKLQTVLVELMGEAMWHAGRAMLQERGADKEVVQEQAPSPAMLQQTILRPSIEKFKQHPLLDGYLAIEEDNQPQHPIAKAGHKVFEGQVMYAYDVESVRESFQEYFRPYFSKREDAEYWIGQHAREAGEFIWEHIDGAVQTMLGILASYAGTQAQQAVARRRNLKPAEVGLKLPSKEGLREFSQNMFDLWFENLPIEFDSKPKNREEKSQDPFFIDPSTGVLEESRRRGRPADNEKIKERKRQELWGELSQVMQLLVNYGRPVDQLNVAGELGITDRGLRDKLNDYGMNWREIKKAEVKNTDN